MFKLLQNVQLYSPGREGLRHVLVAGDKIAYIGANIPSLDPCLDVEITDFKGARLIPGFIDAHAHLTGGGGGLWRREWGPKCRRK